MLEGMAHKKLTPKKQAEFAADLARVWWRLLPYAKVLHGKAGPRYGGDDDAINVHDTAWPVINKHLGPADTSGMWARWKLNDEGFYLQEGDEDQVYEIIEEFDDESHITDKVLSSIDDLRKYFQSGVPLADPTSAFRELLVEGVTLRDLGEVTHGQMRLALAFREAVGPMVGVEAMMRGPQRRVMLVFDGGAEIADDVMFGEAWAAVEREFGDGAWLESYNNWSATVWAK